MLTFLGDRQSNPFCDGMTRRNFLSVGGLAMGGIGLPNLLLAERQNNIGSSNKSLIMIYMPGGPPHQDMYEIKTEAPSEIRGEFKPIKTNVPGVNICEHLPKIASIADKCVFIRSVVGAKDRHYSYQCLTGRHNDNAPSGGWPEIGSVVSDIDHRAGIESGVPGYVNLSPKMKHKPYNFGDSSFLGVSANPFKPNGNSLSDMSLNGLSLDRLNDRRSLLNSFDRLRRDVDSSGGIKGMDGLNQQAFDILTSSKLADALNVDSESQKTLDMYGTGTDKVQGDAAPRVNRQFLAARRLVEAGARVVTLSYSFWDWHGANFKRAKENLPDFDQAYYALITDLEERGMLDDVTVVAWGEFGRSPKINKNAGRDHYPSCYSVAFAGAGIQGGQVYGKSDKSGSEPAENACGPADLHATIFEAFGINHKTTITDRLGRPFPISDGEPLPLT